MPANSTQRLRPEGIPIPDENYLFEFAFKVRPIHPAAHAAVYTVALRVRQGISG